MKCPHTLISRVTAILMLLTVGICGLPACKQVSEKAETTALNETAAPEAAIHRLNTIYYVDAAELIRSAGGIESEEAYDQLKFLVAVQGLLNRTKPQMFVELTAEPGLLYDEFEFNVDRFWFDYLKSQNYMNCDLPDYEEIKITSINQVLENAELMEFISFQGLAAWDREVYATSNVASTVCGIDGYLPVLSGGKLESLLTGKGIEVKLNLQGKFTAQGTIWDTDIHSTGSKKCDAYLWALDKYGDRVDSTRVGYLVDAYAMAPLTRQAQSLFSAGSMYAHNQVVNHDYFIEHGCFVFDLSPFSDSVPLDDSSYGRKTTTTDYETFKKILKKLYQRNNGEVGVLSGFTPWGIKYTSATGERTEVGGLDGETTLIALANAFNFVVDADAPSMASLASASFYSHVKLESSYSNPTPEPITYDRAKKYVHIYMGDYDGAAWANRAIAKYFTGDLRGDRTVTWAFNPNLSQRIPQAFQFIQQNRTDKDYFICGDSGAGYCFPDLFRGNNTTRKHISGLPDGMDALTRWNQQYYSQFGLTITGFLLSHDVYLGGRNYENQITAQTANAFASFSPNGILSNRLPQTGAINLGSDGRLARYTQNGSNLIFSMLRFDIHYGNVSEDAPRIVNELQTTSDRVIAIRSILSSPKQLGEIMDEVEKQYKNVEFVDAYNYFRMAEAAYR